ncbi:hypothetical protein D9M73_295010 [compost metagenome]
MEQAKVCANHLAMLGFARYQGAHMSTRLKIAGIEMFCAGDLPHAGHAAEDHEACPLHDWQIELASSDVLAWT